MKKLSPTKIYKIHVNKLGEGTLENYICLKVYLRTRNRKGLFIDHCECFDKYFVLYQVCCSEGVVY